MYKRNKLLIFSTFLFLSVIIGASLSVEAANYGGEVQTDGVVGFYEGDSIPSEPDPSEPSKSEIPPVAKKPVGRYPSTGELVKKSLKYIGIITIIIVVLFFIWKRNKEKKGRKSS